MEVVKQVSTVFLETVGEIERPFCLKKHCLHV